MSTFPDTNRSVSEAQRRTVMRWRWAVAIVLTFATITVTYIGANRYVSVAAGQAARKEADITAHEQARLLDSELQKFRLLPIVLEEYPDISQVLIDPGGTAAGSLDRKLTLLADRTGAAIIFLIDASGQRLAASKADVPTYFAGVGGDRQFRQRFEQALKTGAVEFYAKGMTGRLPGIFLARRVVAVDGTRGVIVVKIEFVAQEAAWRTKGISTVVGADGRVLLTSRPSWRFRTMGRELAASRSVRVGPNSALYAVGSAPTSLDGARLVSLRLVAPLLHEASSKMRLWLLSAFLAMILASVALVRSRERRHLLRQAAIKLEAQVAERTKELQAVNGDLRKEAGRRELADRLYREAREDLAQASRLATLGQVTAGVAHELNQPIAAMRVFADNARRLMVRGEKDRVDRKLVQIIELADRMGSITQDLRQSARRRTPALGSVQVDQAIAGVMILLDDRLSQTSFTVDRSTGLAVRADRVRLEQALINLIQNALDALKDKDERKIRLSVIKDRERVRLRVEDNGPGVDRSILPELFTPFATSKATGLGLGLSIARSIAQDFGGTLELEDSPMGGAAFTLTLDVAR